MLGNVTKKFFVNSSKNYSPREKNKNNITIFEVIMLQYTKV